MAKRPTIPLFSTITMLLVVTATIVILLICCLCKCYLRRYNENHPFLVGEDKRIQKNDELKSKVLKQFKNSLKRFKKKRRPSLNNVELQNSHLQSCAICMDEYTGEPKAILIGYLKQCNHFYHFKCIWQWLEKNDHCPLCRGTVKLTEENITGLSLQNLPDLLKDKNIPLSMVSEKATDAISDKRPHNEDNSENDLEASVHSTSEQNIQNEVSVSIPCEPGLIGEEQSNSQEHCERPTQEELEEPRRMESV